VNLKLLLAALLLTITHPASAVIGQDAKQEQVLDAEPEQLLAEAELLASLAGDYTTIKQPDRAIQLLEEALSFNQTLANPCHRLEILTSVAGNYALVGQETKSSALFAQAQKMLETTKYCEPEPSSSARNDPENWVIAAATRHAVDGRHDIALRIATSFGDKYLESMLLGLLNGYTDSELGQPDRDAEIQLKLADYYNRTGQSDKAVQIWLSLVNYYNETGQPDRAAKLQSLASKVEQTFKNSASSTQSQQTQAQTELSRCFAQKETNTLLSIGKIVETLDREQLRQILNICKEIERAKPADVPPLAFKALEQIVVVAQKIANPISRSRTLTAVANLYSSLEKDTEAAKLLDKALFDLQAATQSLRQGANPSPGLDPNSSTPKDLSPDQQLQWTSKINDATQAIGDIIAGYSNIGQFERALEVAKRLQTGELYLGVNFNYAYENVIPGIVAAYAKAGQFEQAFKLANGLRREGGRALVPIAEQYASIGQYQQAIDTALMIKNLEIQNKTNIIYNIIERAINAGKLDWAVQATQTIDWTKQATQATGQTIGGATNESRLYRNKLLLAIAREYAELRQFDRAIEAVNRMSSDEIGNYRRIKALSAIAGEYAQAEQTEEAVKLLEQAVKIARSISPPTLTSPRSSPFSTR
jgi:tetratricopeptide (TPR) repeat protein